MQGTLILEGGGMRGVFTAGVLDYLMEQDVRFKNVIGISAGACNGTSYVSEQIGRSKQCMINDDKRTTGFNIKHFVKSHSLIDMDTYFDEYPRVKYPFDFETYKKSESNCYIGATNCVTGEIEFFEERMNQDRLLKACRASSSLPLISPVVIIDDKPFLDGGIADSIPLEKAIELGEKKIVLILTRRMGYRKSPTTRGMRKILEASYKKYPELIKVARRRFLKYNKVMDVVERLEDEGKIFVIRPNVKEPKRMETENANLEVFYNHGYQTMEEQYENLKEYMFS